MMNPKRAYQEAAVRGTSPVRLTVLLYDQIIQDVGRADHALNQNRIDICAQEIGHAAAIIGYLQATLRSEAAPGIARNLGRFYTRLRDKLMEAQVRSSRQVLEQLRQELNEVREAWATVEAETALVAQ